MDKKSLLFLEIVSVQDIETKDLQEQLFFLFFSTELELSAFKMLLFFYIWGYQKFWVWWGVRGIRVI